MSEKQKVLLYHLLDVNEQFLNELHSRVIITRKQAQKINALGGTEQLDALFSILQKSTKANLKTAILECLDASHQSFTKQHIGNILSGSEGPGDEQRSLLLKVQKKRHEIKTQLQNPMSLVGRLREKGFLNEDQVKQIRAKTDRESQTNTLINSVVRNAAIEGFLEELKVQNYGSLASEIEELEVDEAGQILDMAKISIILRLVERRGTQDPILQDMSKELDPVCKKFFAAGSPLSEKYRVEYNSHSKGPYTLVLIKLPGYSRRVFYRDLLNKEIAKAMDTEISQSDFIKRTKKRVNIALDVDIRQLKDVGNSVDQRDGSPSSLTLGATDADEDEDNEGEDEENDTCGCDGDGSCVETTLNNYHVTQGDSQRTEIVLKAATEMVKKHVMLRGAKQWVHTPHEIYQLLAKNLPSMSYALVKRNAPMTILHVSALEGRTDVMQVLFDLGMVREFKDVPVKDDRSIYENKTLQQILQGQQFFRARDKFKELVELDKSFKWLHHCAQIGRLECVETLIERHRHLVYEEAKDKSTPLYWAISSGNLYVVKALLHAGAKMNCRVGDGETLLTRAVAYCQHDIAKCLVQDYGCSLEERGVDQKTPVELAVQKLDVNMLDMLLENGANADYSLTLNVARDGNMALMNVLKRCGHMRLDAQDPGGRSPLLMAVEKGNLPMVKMMIENAADMDVADKQRRNIIHKAAESKNLEVLQYVCEKLVGRGRLEGKINQQDRYLGQERCFVVRGRDNGVAAFHYVEVERRFMNVFRQITRDGGTVDVARYGNTIRSGWGTNPTQEIVNEMDQRYDLAHIDASAAEDLTPLNLAILREFPQGAEMLATKYKADVNIPDSFGMTPLHMAAMRGYFDLSRDLVERSKAKVDVKDTHDQIPAVMAETNRHMKIYNYLEGKWLIDSAKLKQFHGKLDETKEGLSSDSLEGVRKQGENVQRKMIEVVRSLQDEINNLLFEFGSATIQEESAPIQQST